MWLFTENGVIHSNRVIAIGATSDSKKTLSVVYDGGEARVTREEGMRFLNMTEEDISARKYDLKVACEHDDTIIEKAANEERLDTLRALVESAQKEISDRIGRNYYIPA